MNYLLYTLVILSFIFALTAKSQEYLPTYAKLNQNQQKAFVPPQNLLSGTWIGTYSCPQGITRLNLQITAKNSGRVDAILNFSAHPDNPTVPSGSFTMTGTYQASNDANVPGSLYLKAVKWLKQPPGYTAADLQGNVFISDKKISGTVIGPGCSTFTVIKQ